MKEIIEAIINCSLLGMLNLLDTMRAKMPKIMYEFCFWFRNYKIFRLDENFSFSVTNKFY